MEQGDIRPKPSKAEEYVIVTKMGFKVWLGQLRKLLQVKLLNTKILCLH